MTDTSNANTNEHKISAIVAFDNAVPLQENFFDDLKRSGALGALDEVVMVSDHCLNSETMKATRWFEKVNPGKAIVVELKENAGYSKVNNYGVAAASGDLLLFVNFLLCCCGAQSHWLAGGLALT